MEYFVQQVINGITLGSIYGLIAIGYTMVYGIIGMINFAHGDIFMIGAFMALIVYLILTTFFVGVPVAVALIIMMIVAMILTSLWNWSIERVAYRPLARFLPPCTADHCHRHVDCAVQFHSGCAGPAQQANSRRLFPAITIYSART